MKIFLLVLILLAVAQACLLKAEEGGPAAARVNGVPITEQRLERYFAEFLEDRGRAVTSIRNPGVYKELRQQALQQLIDKELLFQEATKQNVQINEAEVQARIEEVRSTLGPRFTQVLADAGFDEASFADYTRHDMAAQTIYQAMTRVEEPKASDVLAFYEKERETAANAPNQSPFASVEPEQGLALARNLLFEREQARARQALLQRLREQSRIERVDER